MTVMRLVCADREPLTLRLLAARFEASGWQVGCASTADAALRTIESLRPHAVVTDIQLSASSGLSLVRHVREHEDPLVASTPILVLSHLRHPGVVATATRAGADSYMTKPFDLVALETRLLGLVADGRRAR